MASVPFASSFLAGSLLSLLVPVCLLIAIVIWYVRAIRSIPENPVETAQHAAGPAEVEGPASAREAPSPPGRS
jgi:hypothetical protein